MWFLVHFIECVGDALANMSTKITRMNIPYSGLKRIQHFAKDTLLCWTLSTYTKMATVVIFIWPLDSKDHYIDIESKVQRHVTKLAVMIFNNRRDYGTLYKKYGWKGCCYCFFIARIHVLVITQIFQQKYLTIWCYQICILTIETDTRIPNM